MLLRILIFQYLCNKTPDIAELFSLIPQKTLLALLCVIFVPVSLCSCFVFLSLWDQSGNFTFFTLLISSLFPDDPLFFPPPFHCCLSEKEVQLECLFDGESSSVVFSFHFHSLVSCSSSSWVFKASGSSLPLYVYFLFIPFGQRCLRWPFSFSPRFDVFSPDSIPASLHHPENHQNHFQLLTTNTHTIRNLCLPPDIPHTIRVSHISITGNIIIQ